MDSLAEAVSARGERKGSKGPALDSIVRMATVRSGHSAGFCMLAPGAVVTTQQLSAIVNSKERARRWRPAVFNKTGEQIVALENCLEHI